jgi:hypothetical protein
MKFNKKYILVIIYTLVLQIFSLRTDPKDSPPEKVPIINVHMEEPDRDPLEVKRIEEERRIERNRIRDMETLEEMDKRSFQQIISMQNNQIAKLTTIADNTNKILTNLMKKNQPKMFFKQKNKQNGPINII